MCLSYKLCYFLHIFETLYVPNTFGWRAEKAQPQSQLCQNKCHILPSHLHAQSGPCVCDRNTLTSGDQIGEICVVHCIILHKTATYYIYGYSCRLYASLVALQLRRHCPRRQRYIAFSHIREGPGACMQNIVWCDVLRRRN